MASNKLYAGNLVYAVTSDELKEVFSAYGTVTSATVIEGKGFGFVEMSTPEEAAAAKAALDGKDYKGRKLKVDEAKPPREKGSGGGGYGGGRDRGGNRGGYGGGNRY